MSKLHFLVPLAGLLVFGGFYWRYERELAARLAQQEQIRELARKTERDRHRTAQLKAQADAAAMRRQHEAERAAAAQLEAERKQALVDAEQSLRLADQKHEQLRRQLIRLRAEHEHTAAMVAHLEEQRRELQAEERFLEAELPFVEENREALYAFLEQAETVAARGHEPPPARPPSRTQ